jgi:dTDP-4-dehydrorhamnose 3,5-epimerase
MKINKTKLSEVLLLEPEVYKDERGYFFESYNDRDLLPFGIGPFVQDNQSFSYKNILRGLHYQIKHPQGKLVRVLSGEIYDVAIDIRQSSPTFLEWVGVKLTEENKKMLWIPPGFAHGFVVISDFASVLYKVTDYRYQEYERTVRWNDPSINISWPIEKEPCLSEKDAAAEPFKFFEVY